MQKITNKIPKKTDTEKRRPIDKNMRHIVWEKYNKKEYEGKCYCCGDTIYIKSFHVGHNKAVAKGGDDSITNLRPICSSCNLSMKTMSIEEYKKMLGKGSIGKKVSKIELLKSLPTSKLRKLTKELNIEVDCFFEPSKDDYFDALMSSRKVTIDKINEILNK